MIITRVIKKNSGETFAETLVALLIGVLSLLMLSVSIVTAAKINNKIRTDRKLSTVEERTGTEVKPLESASVWMNEETNTVSGVDVYIDEAGYVYYEYNKTNN